MYFSNQTTVFLDGAWVSAGEAKASLYDQTLHYGNGVFEGIRAYRTADGPRIFKANEHYQRLHYSAGRMGIQVPFSVEELTEISYLLLEKNGLSDAYIRPLVYTGPNMALTTPAESHVFVCAWKWGKLLGDNLIRLKTASFCRPHPKSCFVDAKVCGHYTNSILATTEARQAGYDEALLLDVEGFVAEAPGANFFVEIGGELITPPLGNILPGITRATIFELCKRDGIRVREQALTLDQVRGADGAFLVGTAAEVTGAQSLDDVPYRLRWENTIGATLQRAYLSKVRQEEFTETYL